MSEFEVGQKVRFTTDVYPFKKGEEGTVIAVAASFLRVTHPTDDPGWPIRPNEVEPAKPPVETFGPGDIVRAKARPSCVYALSDKGYTYLQDCRGLFADYRKSTFRPEDFTSEDFEKVAFAEVPF